MILSALTFLIYRSLESISFCLAVGAIISLYMDIDIKKKMSHKSESLFKNTGLTNKFARGSLFILISLYFFLWIIFKIYS